MNDIAWAEGGASYETLKEFFAEAVGADEDEIKPSASLEDLGADSLDMVEFLMRAEDHFECPIADEKAATFRTFGDVVQAFQTGTARQPRP